jgi:hypothetical protein
MIGLADHAGDRTVVVDDRHPRDAELDELAPRRPSATCPASP